MSTDCFCQIQAFPVKELTVVLAVLGWLAHEIDQRGSHKPSWGLIVFVHLCSREGPSVAQAPGSHQRIGDVLLRNMRQLKVVTVGEHSVPSGPHCLEQHSPQSCFP